MDSLQRFTFLLGVYVVSLGLICATDYIPESLREDIKKVKEHIKMSDGDKRLFGNPVFVKHLENLDSKYQVGLQKLLVHEILDTYATILRKMKNNIENESVQLSIANIEGAIGVLDKSFLKYNDLKKTLQELWAIKTGDLTMQKKAIMELMKVYQKASILAHKTNENQRKRRQAVRRQLR
ncbi:interferon gamma 1-like [Brienomyrus brachyistius]|uniref:interferon gamma 1-like n=1 Tax=Brienomyrus brachyistius TaxID=42636 RepID=UPI0020B2644C|nr:interferon gamma 1-like [Brienomyrus brachyistius]